MLKINSLTETLKRLLKLAKEGKVITVAEKIKEFALYLDHCGYGRAIKEIKKDYRPQCEAKK